MLKLNCIGDVCPIPVIKLKKTLEGLTKIEDVEISVDNTAAVGNVGRLCEKLGYKHKVEEDGKNWKILVLVDKLLDKEKSSNLDINSVVDLSSNSSNSSNTVVVISKNHMGEGDETLGKILLKGFIYSLTQIDKLPKTILFYNSGVFVSTEGSESINDLKALEGLGVEIFSCGTCLNHYKLTEKLQVGKVCNMYDIVSKLSSASLVIKP